MESSANGWMCNKFWVQHHQNCILKIASTKMNTIVIDALIFHAFIPASFFAFFVILISDFTVFYYSICKMNAIQMNSSRLLMWLYSVDDDDDDDDSDDIDPTYGELNTKEYVHLLLFVTMFSLDLIFFLFSFEYDI